MKELKKKIPIHAGPAAAAPPPSPYPEASARRAQRAPTSSGLGGALVALASVAGGVAALFGAQEIGLLKVGRQRPVASVLLAEAVAQTSQLSAARVASLGQETHSLDAHENLLVGYDVSTVDGGTVRIEARLEDRESGKVLERFVTWRKR
jgi:hypothetical protein